MAYLGQILGKGEGGFAVGIFPLVLSHCHISHTLMSHEMIHRIVPQVPPVAQCATAHLKRQTANGSTATGALLFRHVHAKLNRNRIKMGELWTFQNKSLPCWSSMADCLPALYFRASCEGHQLQINYSATRNRNQEELPGEPRGKPEIAYWSGSV